MLLMLAAISEQGICSKTAISFVAKVLKKAEVSMSVYLRVCHLVVCCMYVYLSLCMVCSGMFMGSKLGAAYVLQSCLRWLVKAIIESTSTSHPSTTTSTLHIAIVGLFVLVLYIIVFNKKNTILFFSTHSLFNTLNFLIYDSIKSIILSK